MRVFVIRHGQTNWNLEGKIQGSTNIPLNENGIKEAEVAREIVNSLEIDLIICSTLDRAKQTAQIVNKDKNAPIIYDERIMERNYGEFEGASSKGINFREYLNYYDNKEIKGGETIQEFCKRVFGFLEEIEQKIKLAESGIEVLDYIDEFIETIEDITQLSQHKSRNNA